MVDSWRLCSKKLSFFADCTQHQYHNLNRAKVGLRCQFDPDRMWTISAIFFAMISLASSCSIEVHQPAPVSIQLSTHCTQIMIVTFCSSCRLTSSSSACFLRDPSMSSSWAPCHTNSTNVTHCKIMNPTSRWPRWDSFLADRASISACFCKSTYWDFNNCISSRHTNSPVQDLPFPVELISAQTVLALWKPAAPTIVTCMEWITQWWKWFTHSTFIFSCSFAFHCSNSFTCFCWTASSYNMHQSFLLPLGIRLWWPYLCVHLLLELSLSGL